MFFLSIILDLLKGYDEIVAYLEDLAKKNQKFAKYDVVGKSYEGRDIPVIIVTDFSKNTTKQAIWFNSGQHAREWIGPASLLYILSRLFDYDSGVFAWLGRFEFHITPMQNPGKFFS